MSHIAFAACQGFGAVVDSLLIFRAIPIIMFLALGVWEAEDAAPLAIDVIAGSRRIGAHCCLPERVIVDYGCLAVVGVSKAKGHDPDKKRQ